MNETANQAAAGATVPNVRLSPAEAGFLIAERYGANRLSEAEALCRAWLSAQPEAIGALHMLGVICLESGRRHEAQERRQGKARGVRRRNSPAAHPPL